MREKPNLALLIERHGTLDDSILHQRGHFLSDWDGTHPLQEQFLGVEIAAGANRRAPAGYRPGHTLGYLTAAEYAYIKRSVNELWASGAVQAARSLDLDRSFRASIPDASVRQRLLARARSKRPAANDAELIAEVLENYRRDRR